MTSGNPGPEWREVWSAVRGPTATAIMNLAERELGINNPIKYLPRLPDDRKDPQPLIDDGTNHPGSTSRRQRGIVMTVHGGLLHWVAKSANSASLGAPRWTTY